jgi:hypothetical protein
MATRDSRCRVARRVGASQRGRARYVFIAAYLTTLTPWGTGVETIAAEDSSTTIYVIADGKKAIPDQIKRLCAVSGG